jgi:hypothetical protein
VHHPKPVQHPSPAPRNRVLEVILLTPRITVATVNVSALNRGFDGEFRGEVRAAASVEEGDEGGWTGVGVRNQVGDLVLGLDECNAGDTCLPVVPCISDISNLAPE